MKSHSQISIINAARTDGFSTWNDFSNGKLSACKLCSHGMFVKYTSNTRGNDKAENFTCLKNQDIGSLIIVDDCSQFVAHDHLRNEEDDNN